MLFQKLSEHARDEGFPLTGAVDLEKAFLEPHVARYDDWLARGHAGAMSYLVRGRDRRSDPRILFPEARSVFCVGFPYPKLPRGEAPARGVRYARYIEGRDYHLEMAERLERALERTRASFPDLRWKVCVDTSAVLERSWAAMAGLGWLGKNTLLIHPRHGSYFFVGEAILSMETGKGPVELPDYCGNCRRCIDSCPTGAIEEPHRVDSNRCISYVTLEKRGAIELAAELRPKVGNWVAGCDLCQETCPFNTKPVKQASNEHSDLMAEWEKLLDESPEEYRARVSKSSLKRVKPEQFRRNLALALANSAEALKAELDEGAFQEILARAEARFAAETDPDARDEWRRCLERLSGR